MEGLKNKETIIKCQKEKKNVFNKVVSKIKLKINWPISC